jgi:peptidoglycan-associated lipoprotein
MKRPGRLVQRIIAVGYVAIVALLVGGCASKQPHARAPMSPSSDLVGTTNRQAPPTSVPNTPTATNISISTDILRACNIPDTDAYFAFDSSSLTAFDHAPLDAVATCFTEGPMRGRRLRLIGHADPRGQSDYNMTLGQSRADGVGSYLMQHNVTSARVTTTSRGALDATGHDETGWAHDRRVDILLGD